MSTAFVDGALVDGTVVPVVVVGGGPVGVTAAALLAARGVRTVVLERWPEVYALPRAVHLDDEIYRVLQGVTGIDAVAPLFTPMLGLRLLDARHRTMAELRRDRPVGFHGLPQANMFDQPDLERALRAHLATLPAATLVGGAQVTAVEQADGPQGAEWPAPVRVTVSGTDRKPVRLYAQAVLGCDGANSLVREAIGSRLLDLGFEQRWLVVDVRTDRVLDTWDGVHQVCDPRRAATFMRVGPGRYRWEFRLLGSEKPDDLLTPDRFARLLAPWTGSTPMSELEVLRSAEYTFKARIADRWRDRRVFLLGDAAHLTPPFIGQGLCAGLRDASNLSWKLAGVLTDTLDETVLGTYETERRPHAEALVRKAVRVGWAMTGGRGSAALVRRVVLAAVSRLSGLGDKVLDEPPPSFAPGPLVAPARRGLTGALCPQPWVRIDGKRRRLDDVLGDGFAVLTLDAPGRALLDAAQQHGMRLLRVDSGHSSGPQGAPGVRSSAATVVADDDGDLTAWLATRDVRSVAVRPDRVVAAQSRLRDGGDALAADLRGWTWLRTTTRSIASQGTWSIPPVEQGGSPTARAANDARDGAER